MNTVERVVRGWMEEAERPDERPKVQLSPRISAGHYDMLDAVAERLKTTKHGLATELLEAAIEDAGHLVGVEFIQDSQTGEWDVGLFDQNPMEEGK